MKVLLDACVWGGASQTDQRAGYDVETVSDWLRDPGDQDILAHALDHTQVLVTLDKDFGELTVVWHQPHRGIIRLVDLRARDQGPAIVMALAKYGEELLQGAIVTVEPGRVRVRPSDLHS